MLEILKNTIKNAYSPYYNFKVAALVVMKDGKIFKGVNVENANGTSICAERNAIASAVAEGYKKGDFDKLYVLLENGNFGTPCFACRQVILEFFDKTSEIISISIGGEEKKYTVSELCPYPFDSEDLK